MVFSYPRNTEKYTAHATARKSFITQRLRTQSLPTATNRGMKKSSIKMLERELKRADYRPRAAKRDQWARELKGKTGEGIAKVSTS